MNQHALSFADVVGMDLAKRALLLLAVDPLLGGVVIPASVGSGKSTLARAFANILPHGTPFIELPVNATEDRLIGGLDLEVALSTGKRVIEKGLLARAHGGVLYIDSLNLLEASTSALLMDTLSRGAVVLEREGVSDTHPAAFMLVATYDQTDGDVSMGLLDRLGIIVPFVAQNDAETRVEVVRRIVHKKRTEESDDEHHLLRGLILAARELLPNVIIYDEQLDALAQTALELGIEGNRVDVFAARAAVANAALDGRRDVQEQDLKLAAKLVLMPRATRLPEEDVPPQEQPEQQLPKEMSKHQTENNDAEEPPTDDQPEKTPEDLQELLMESLESELPKNLLSMPFMQQRKGNAGKRSASENTKRGRYVRSQSGNLRDGKLALVPTLMAAAPWQKVRKQARATDANVVIAKDDIRIKRFRDKSGTLFVFIVDSSGSMALNRMRQAKGAVAQLLQNAYVHRDQVALIAFRGKKSELLLPPSQSVERAKRALDVLPTGGGTPLASALMLAYQTVMQVRSKGMKQATLVLLTDGRANTALDAMQTDKQKIAKELHDLSAMIRAENIASVVIDTQMNFVSRGEAEKLAAMLGGKYVYLPNARSEHIAAAVSA